MKYDITKLQRFSTYARNNKKSVMWVYDLAKNNKIKIVEVDTMKFVLVD